MSSTKATSKAVRETVDGKQLLPQAVVEAPPTPINTPTGDLTQLQSYGEHVLLFVPTRNEFKVTVLEKRIKDELKGQRNLLIPYSEDLDSGVGQQPYDEKGLEGAWTRIRNGLAWLNNNKHILEEKKVGTVLVAAIENYIQRGEPAVDYGIVVIYNATINKVATAISRGVTVPGEFLKEAEAYGFDDDAKKCGKRTVGKVLAETFGIDHRNWHEVVCGISRYQLLTDAVSKLDVPLYKRRSQTCICKVFSFLDSLRGMKAIKMR
jgi:hypothetical protein